MYSSNIIADKITDSLYNKLLGGGTRFQDNHKQ